MGRLSSQQLMANGKQWLFVVVLLLCGCRPEGTGLVVQAYERPLTPSPTACNGRFLPHDLPHITAAAAERVGFFISNGSGLAVNDLDNDGDLDFVLGNLLGPNQLFWNDGNWQFRAETLFDGSTRAVTAVDVDADGWLDLVFTARNGDVRHWHNDGNGRFSQTRLVGVDNYAYSLDWGDLDDDGDLDLVTASYDADLEKQTPLYRESNRAGVTVYLNNGGRFSGTRLSNEAQALAVQLLDLNADGRLDILVGNDFDVRDFAWLASDDGWHPAEPFTTTTMSTMSFALGDVDNNGRSELLATDMHPYANTPDIMAQWQPVMEMMSHDMVPGDPQQMENVLQSRDDSGTFANIAVNSGIAASGWSWSSKFGDLNQDGFLDLYVVNGMQALDNFSHLPNDELVEENQAYGNDGTGRFAPQPNWALNSRYGGRSMSMADFDNDGDLDILINNLRAPAQLFENQLCEGRSLQLDLRWPGSANHYALGAVVTLQTSNGRYSRELHPLSGYLSGDPSRLHFGFPHGTTLQTLEVRWPDGERTLITDLEPTTLLTVTRQQ